MGSGDRQTDKTQTGWHCSRAMPDAKQAQEGPTVVITGTRGRAGGWPSWPPVGEGCSGAGVSPLPLPSLLSQKKSKVHYHVAVIINYLGHCVSLVALMVAFVLFLRLR